MQAKYSEVYMKINGKDYKYNFLTDAAFAFRDFIRYYIRPTRLKVKSVRKVEGKLQRDAWALARSFSLGNMQYGKS